MIKKGDKIVALLDEEDECFFAGDVGVVCGPPTPFPEDEALWADFNGQGNPGIVGDGIWCIGVQEEEGAWFSKVESEEESQAVTEDHAWAMGDIIEITDAGRNKGEFFEAGDLAEITGVDIDGDFYANFKGQDNALVYGDGLWCVGANNPKFSSTRFKLHTAVAKQAA